MQISCVVYRNYLFHKLVVGHVPLILSKVLSKFLKLAILILICKVTKKQANWGKDYVFEILVIYTRTQEFRT